MNEIETIKKLHSSYADIIKIHSDYILAVARIESSALIAKHSSSVLDETIRIASEQSGIMIFHFSKMGAPEEMIDKYIEATEALVARVAIDLTKKIQSQ